MAEVIQVRLKCYSGLIFSGWLTGDIETDDFRLRRLSVDMGVTIVIPGYRYVWN